MVLGLVRAAARCLGGAGDVEGELAEESAGGAVGDPDVAGLDKGDHTGRGAGSADTDRAEPALVAEGDLAGFVDAVAS